MKRILLTALIPALSLTSCESPADTARLGRLADLAITYATIRGVLPPADAAAIREAKTIILPEDVSVAPSGK